MDPDRWQALERAFHEVRHLSPAERCAHFQANGTPQELQDELEVLCKQRTDSFLEPPSLEFAGPASLVGQQLGINHLTGILGRGGMGVVYRAKQVGLDREVAVKVCDLGASTEALASERFKREALAVSRLDHPGIVPILSYGEEDHLLYYAMQLIEGPSLRQVISKRSQAPPGMELLEQYVVLIRDVVSALAYSHSRGVLHRDIKPENILIDKDGRSKVIDFGLAKVLSLSTLTRTGYSPGTPYYMSPEQVRAQGSTVDEGTDIYSAGAVLHELLTGSPPFEGKDIGEVLYRITHEDVKPLRASCRQIPKDLEKIVLKALRRDRRSRYETAEQMRDDLDRYLQKKRVLARLPSLAYRLRRSARARLVAGGVVIALFGYTVWSASNPNRVQAASSLTLIDCPTHLDGADLSVTRWQGLEMGWSSPATLDLQAGQNELQLATGSHEYLIQQGSAFAEIRRDWETPNLDLSLVRLSTHQEVQQGMARFAGGQTSCTFRMMTPAGIKTIRKTFSCADFLLDREPVTIAQYRAFMEATKTGLPSRWESAIRFWNRPPRSDWDQLPMVGVTIEEARKYAEWAGKRLPNMVEWNLAVSVSEQERSSPDWQSGVKSLILARGGGEDTIPGFMKHSRPAAEAGRLPGIDLLQQFGNVSIWLQDSATLVADGKRVWHFQAGGHWATSAAPLLDGRIPAPLPTLGANFERGFRCAKSISPPTPPFTKLE